MTAQSFFIPADATRLFLGTMDGFGWFNNVGSLTVTVNDHITAVPEPATLGLMTIGMGVAAIVRCRRRQRKV